MRVKKRYEHENQIRADIDRFKAKAQKLRDAASALDMRADLLVKNNGAGGFFGEISFARSQAEKKRKSAGRIETDRLVKLKQKLAEFQTEPIPGILPDRSTQR